MMIYALHQFPIMYELWHFKGHEDANTKFEDLDKLRQAIVISKHCPKPFQPRSLRSIDFKMGIYRFV